MIINFNFGSSSYGHFSATDNYSITLFGHHVSYSELVVPFGLYHRKFLW